jgi:anti-anti-sigma factor
MGQMDDCRRVCPPLPSLAIDELLRIEVSESDGATVIRVAGDVAYASCRLLQDELVAHVERGQRVVLDCSGVTLLDSSGIGVILRAHRALSDVDGTLVVRNPTAVTQQVLEVTGLADLLIEKS